MKKEKREEREEKFSSKKKQRISAQQMAKQKEKGSRRLQECQHKKQAEELAIGMVARNEVLEQLGHKVRWQSRKKKEAVACKSVNTRSRLKN